MVKAIRWILFIPASIALHALALWFSYEWFEWLIDDFSILITIVTFVVSIAAFTMPAFLLLIAPHIAPNTKVGYGFSQIYAIYTVAMFSYMHNFEFSKLQSMYLSVHIVTAFFTFIIAGGALLSKSEE